MLQNQETYYRKFGVRLLTQLQAPAMHDLKHLELPRESVYHYLTFDGLTSGPANDDQLLRNIRSTIPMYAPLLLRATQGAPRRMGGSGAELVRDYVKAHRRMQYLPHFESGLRLRDVPLLVNYALLDQLYRYQASTFASYNRWRNLFATAMTTIADIAAEAPRNHYLFLNTPRTLPSVGQLQLASEKFEATEVKVFREPASYMLLELWKYVLHPDKASLLNLVPKDKIHLVNFVFVEAGKWCLINLGQLVSFSLDAEQKEQAPELVIRSKMHVTPRQLAIRLLRMYMSIMETRNAAIKRALLLEKQMQQQEEEESKPDAQDTDKPAAVSLPNLSIIDEGEMEDLTQDDFGRLVAEQDVEIHQDLKQLDQLANAQQVEETTESVQDLIAAEVNHAPEQGVLQACDKMATSGAISAAEYRRFIKLASNYKEQQAPFNQGPLEEFLKIDPQLLLLEDDNSIVDSPMVLDKSMLKSKLNQFDSKYVKHVLHRDIANVVMALQRAGIAVTSYRVEKNDDILGGYEDHIVRLAPVVGQPSTLRFKLPIIREDGTYVTNGVKYRLRKQRVDLPIRKTAPNVVALTSYYGKCFITRGRRNSDNYGHWLKSAAMTAAIDPQNTHLTDAICADVFDPTIEAPPAYSAVSRALAEVTVDGRYRLKFNLKDAMAADGVTMVPKLAPLYVGKDMQTGASLFMTFGGMVQSHGPAGVQELGRLEGLLNIATQNAPLDYVTARVFGKDIPLGVILAMEMGLEKLIAALRVTPRVVPAGERVSLGTTEFALQFSDETLVFSRNDRMAALILGGFTEYHRSLRLFSAHSFGQRGVYVNLLETNGVSVRFVRELDLMSAMFIDPITRDILVQMKEPTSFQGLLLRACELLLDDRHPNELDPAFMRIKGYERVSGAIYTEMIMSLRAHNGALGKANSSVQMNPYAVWKRISEDPVKLQVSEINPLAALKDQEAVTYVGEGGRGKRSMTKDTRTYHPNDMGTISEATVDSSDVAVNIHTSADPMFTSLRGMSARFDLKNPNITSLLSTSALLAPASDRDDPKRVNFVSIQQKHAVACHGYHQHMVRTGYDSVLAHRTDSLYAYTAKQPGTVKQINAQGIIVVYEDGSQAGYEIGRRFGNAQGLTVAHEVVTPLKEGDTFAKGDPIVYNTGFFEPDFFNPKQIVWKNSLAVRTVLWESGLTHEDSSSISSAVAKKLATRITKPKMIVVTFDQAISSLVKVGQKVDAETVLCVIQDAVAANSKLFNEQSIETLKILNAQTPRARVKGVIERIEVFYHGDKEDMSESIRELCDWGDSQLRQRANSVGAKFCSGSVDAGFRIDNNALGLDHVAIRVYITSDVGAGVGDKGVFANQLKTCFGEVMEHAMRTEDGQEIHAIFGYRSLEARIVESPMVIGGAASLLKTVAARACAIYRGTDK